MRMNNREPVPLSDTLDRLLGHLRRPPVKVSETVREHWPELVGSALAAATRPVDIVDGTLTVEVHDPVVAEQVRWQRGDLVRTLAGLVGDDRIRDVRVVVVPGSRP